MPRIADSCEKLVSCQWSVIYGRPWEGVWFDNMDQDDDDESVDIEKTKHHTDERGGRNSFRRKRFSRALSGLSIETSMRSLSTRKNGDQLSSRKQNNERSELLDSIRWLGRHIGGSVFSFLIEQTQNEGAKLIEELDRSMSSLGASTPEDIASGKSLEKLGVVEKMQNLLQNSIPSVHFETDDDSSSASSSDEPIPPASKLHSALLFVDISGFTKFSTSLNVELLSKVSSYLCKLFVGMQKDR